jgi:hypothetical protein
MKLFVTHSGDEVRQLFEKYFNEPLRAGKPVYPVDASLDLQSGKFTVRVLTRSELTRWQRMVSKGSRNQSITPSMLHTILGDLNERRLLKEQGWGRANATVWFVHQLFRSLLSIFWHFCKRLAGLPSDTEAE